MIERRAIPGAVGPVSDHDCIKADLCDRVWIHQTFGVVACDFLKHPDGEPHYNTALGL